MREVAAGRKKLVMGDSPKVGLVIFDFDTAQRDGKVWSEEQLKRLQDNLGKPNVIARGDPENLKLPT